MTAPRLALAHLKHDRKRSLVCLAGTGFAATLLFMQLGFRGAVEATAVMLFDRLRFDLLLTSSEYIDLTKAGAVRRDRLAAAGAVPGVAAVRPLTVAPAGWRNPTRPDLDPERGGRQWVLSVLATDPASLGEVFAPGIFAGPPPRAELARDGAVLLDRKSRRDFGDPDAMPAGTRAAVNGRAVELVGYFELGTGFSYAGLLLASEDTAAGFGAAAPDRVTLGLVTLDAGADPRRVAAAVRAALPADVTVRTRPAVLADETDYWTRQTAIGVLFTAGVGLAVVVGGVFVYQMMTADIRRRLPEFATLTAVGYGFGFLARVVLWQAALLGVGGFALGLAAAVGLYRVTAAATGLPMELTPASVATVLGLTVGMCVASGLLAVRVVRAADPADLF